MFNQKSSIFTAHCLTQTAEFIPNGISFLKNQLPCGKPLLTRPPFCDDEFASAMKET
jgi:hypothetical protein